MAIRGAGLAIVVLLLAGCIGWEDGSPPGASSAQAAAPGGGAGAYVAKDLVGTWAVNSRDQAWDVAWVQDAATLEVRTISGAAFVGATSTGMQVQWQEVEGKTRRVWSGTWSADGMSITGTWRDNQEGSIPVPFVMRRSVPAAHQ